MTRDEVDAALASSLMAPAAPEWREGNRTGERRATIPVTVDGLSSPFYLVMTVRLDDPNYLIMLLVAGDRCISRLCLTTSHYDHALLALVDEPHFHSWDANRPKGQSLPRKLNAYETLPASVIGKDAAVSWFFNRLGIESPRWLPVVWPHGSTLL